MSEQRILTLQSWMEQNGLDAAVVTDPRHVYYLTGFLTDPHERFLGLVIPGEGEPVLIVPALEREAAAAVSSVQKIMTHTDTQDPYAVLKQALPDRLKRLGVEKNQLTVKRFEAIAAAVGADAYIDVEAPLQAMRLKKSPDEVQRIKRAIEVIEEVLRRGLQKVKAGVSELEIVAELEYQMKMLGADGPSFITTVLAGEKAALPHGNPGERKIRQGELLLFDLGVYVDGYASDISRTFAVGDVDDRQKAIYDAVLAANLAAIEATRPGVTLASLDQAARDVITERGYGEYFIHRLGHGLGIDVHEYPSVHGENQELTSAGMVFTIEPGIYLPGVGGVRIEDDVLVTDEGVEVLTRFPKELTVIG
ncbi:M24 family metallopeptidase [Brevibacillus massiliensis]|jgi:Xaa-Pro dipeptidase|uniref:M24 family metallopeptidase n=1 Tax=Brevibacillus massiliensis TaxID=1118054 RepID=UPI0002FBC3F6|nr:Xaa-Pro peptidase family protein [Brevibacillus massiliensis]